MNDSTIIKTISKVHFIIVSFFSFIFLLLSLIFFILQDGLTIKEIALPSIHIEQLYIKWNKKLDVSIREIKLQKTSKNKSNLNFNKIIQFVSNIPLLPNIFEKVKIENIDFNNANAMFKFNDTSGGYLIYEDNNIQAVASLTCDNSNILLEIISFQDKLRKIKLNAKIILDTEQNISSVTDIAINNEIFLKVKAFKMKEKIFYKVESQKHIESIKHLLDILSFNKNIRFWVDDAIDTDYLELNKAYGWIDLGDLENAYKNIYVDARLEKLNYMYNKKLDSIHSQYTELEFKEGILFIRPKVAFSYGQNLGDSNIKIDFTQKNVMLKLELLFNGILNKDILEILQAYKIKLPFLQHSGIIDTDIQLLINLQTLDIDVKGIFFTKEANFDYLGLNLNIYDTKIYLNNSSVKIYDMQASYKDIALSKVKVKFDTSKSIGKLDFELEKINFSDINLSLKHQPLKVAYTISQGKDTIEIENSLWSFHDKILDVESLIIPFDFKNLLLNIPTTKVTIDDIAKIYVSGTSSLQTYLTNLDVDLVKLVYQGFVLNQAKNSFKVNYNKQLNITVPQELKVKKDDINMSFDNTYITFHQNNIFTKSSITINDIVTSNAHFDYDMSNKKGMLYLKNTLAQHSDYGTLFSSSEPISLLFETKKDTLELSSKELDTSFKYIDESWILNIESLKNISLKSPLLSSYKLNNGSLNLYKESSNSDINFYASIHYPYKFLAHKNTPIGDYKLNGKFDTDNKSISMNINNKVHIDINDTIMVNAKEIGFDVNQFLKILNSDTNTSSNSSFNKQVILNATDSFLYLSENRHALADTIKLEYFNKLLTANLKYKNGNADFKLDNDTMSLVGQNFNDTFMENLFSLSKFQKGQFHFFLEGTTREYEGSLFLHNTTVMEYKLLNNVLAFVNTIPSLVTFSLPGYNQRGLEVDYAYMNFETKNDDFNISDIYLESKEVDILGRGKVNIIKNKIDLRLNLKTDLASSISKLPVVGYILFDKDSMSTSLKIHGALDNPKVESLIASEIIVAPLNIIKRTILFPFQIFEKEK